MLRNWYSKICSTVLWGNNLSEQFKLTCGIRQGSVLSPILFAVYIDDVLSTLSQYGCKINGISYGSFMFADDLICFHRLSQTFKP